MSSPAYPDWWEQAKPELHAAADDFLMRLEAKLEESPEKIVKRKNPFLFRTKTDDAQELVSALIDAFRSSSEEPIFGETLENMAVTICTHAKHGRKSGIEGIDLEYDEDRNTRVLVQVKSGTNWGNSSQNKALADRFAKATRILKQGKSVKHVRCIEGCCYGASGRKYKGNHEQIVGLEFWNEISEWPSTSAAILDILGRTEKKNLQAAVQQAQARVAKYLEEQCVLDASGKNIRWDQLLKLVLAPKRKRAKKSSDDDADAALQCS